MKRETNDDKQVANDCYHSFQLVIEPACRSFHDQMKFMRFVFLMSYRNHEDYVYGKSNRQHDDYNVYMILLSSGGPVCMSCSELRNHHRYKL